MFRTCSVLFLSVMSVSVCAAQDEELPFGDYQARTRASAARRNALSDRFVAEMEADRRQADAERQADRRNRELVNAIRRQGLENQAVLEDALIRQQGEWNRRQINAFYAPSFRQYQAGTMMGFQAWQAQTMRGFNQHYYGQPTRRRSR